jgi:hypothetical protein
MGKKRGPRPQAAGAAQARAAQRAAAGKGGRSTAAAAAPTVVAAPIGAHKGAHNAAMAAAIQQAQKAGKITKTTGAGPTAKAVADSKSGKSFFNMMKGKKGLKYGAAAAVIGGLAYTGRRGEGSSGGRTSMYKY